MGSMTNTPVPEQVRYGERLLPQIVDEAAITTPDRIVGMVAKSSDITQGFTNITMSDLSRAVNFTAYWIEYLGHSSPIRTFAYLGIADFRYMVLELAAIKCGHQALIFSPRNAVTHNIALFNSANCHTLLYAAEMEAPAKVLAEKLSGLNIFQISSFDEMVKSPANDYPYLKTWEEAKDDKVFILHTSGSTGPPKALSFTNGYFAAFDTYRFVPPWDGRLPSNLSLLNKGQLTYFGSPMFHMGGVGFAISVLFYNHTLVLGPPMQQPTGKILVNIMRELDIGAMVVIPSLLENACKEHGEDFAKNSDSLEYLFWIGGPLAQSAGDFIVNNTRTTLTQVYGSTETCILNYVIPPRNHWSAFQFHPTHGPDLEPEDPTSASTLYEVVINRRKNVTQEHAIGQCIFQCFPQIEQWRTKDLFRKHDTEPGLWVFQGRKDDVIILSTGDKVNPVPRESLLQGHPMVTGAIVFGNSRTKCGLLVEVKAAAPEKELLEEIWELTVKENEDSRIPARIERDMIRLASPAKPFIRAGKGTIVRSLTLEEYRDEIQSLYIPQ